MIKIWFLVDYNNTPQQIYFTKIYVQNVLIFLINLFANTTRCIKLQSNAFNDKKNKICDVPDFIFNLAGKYK